MNIAINSFKKAKHTKNDEGKKAALAEPLTKFKTRFTTLTENYEYALCRILKGNFYN